MNKPLNILIFAADKGNRPAHFVGEQMAAIRKIGNITIHCCLCQPKTNLYVKFRLLRQAIKQYHPDIIHAHFGLYGFVANWQRRIPVVTTYHGSDIHSGGLVAKLSKISANLSKYNIYVSNALNDLSKYKGENVAIIPCGVNIDNFVWVSKEDARRRMHLDANTKYILFASDFDTPVKDPELAFQAINELKTLCPMEKIELLELKGYSREEVNTLLHGVDAALMTSRQEGSPQFIKEAVICGTPIVSVNVGDVEKVLFGIKNAYVVNKRDYKILANKLYQALNDDYVTNGVEQINNLGLNNEYLTCQLIKLYKQVARV